MYLIVPQKYWKRFMILILIGIVLVFTGRYLLRLGHELSTEIIKNLIKVETGGRYDIDFEEVKLDVREKRLSIDRLILLPTVDHSSYDKTIYEVEIDRVVMHLKSLKSIYLNSELTIDSVRIIDPSLKLSNPTERIDSSSFSTRAGEIYNIISDQLSVLSIGKFRIENADLKHYPSNFKLEDIQFSISDLLMDSSQQSSKVFYSNNIVLELNDQRLLMPDSVHEIGFERFILSTKDSVLRFKNAFIRPVDTVKVSFFNQNKINVYDIELPLISLKGVDYVKAYNQNTLAIEDVSIDRPSILIDDETDNKQAGDTTDNNLLKMLTSVFDRVEIGRFTIGGANVNLKLYGGTKEQHLSSRKTDISMFGIKIDTINAALESQYSYFDSASFTLFDYQYNLPDSIHQIMVKSFTLDTRDSSMRFSDLELKPIRNLSGSKQLAWLKVPKGELTGARFKMALLGDRLILRDFVLHQPQLRVRPGEATGSNYKMAITPSGLYDLLSVRYNKFKSRGLKIIDGSFELVDQGSIKDFQLSFSSIELDPSVSLWTDLVKSLDIDTGPIQWKKDTLELQVGKLAISEKGRQLKLYDVKVRSENEFVDASIPELFLMGHKPNLLASGEFYVDTLKINSPKLALQALKGQSHDSTTRTLEGILPQAIGYLLVDDGQFSLAPKDKGGLDFDHFSIAISSDDNQPLDLLEIKNVKGRIEHPISSNYEVKEITYDRSQRLFEFSDASVFHSDSLWLNFGEVRIPNLYQKGLLSANHLLTSEFQIGKVTGVVSVDKLKQFQQINKKSKGDFQFTTTYLQAKLDDITVYGNGSSLLLDTLTIGMNNLSTANHDLISSDHLLFAESVDLAGDFQIVNHQADTLTISGLQFGSKNGSLDLAQVQFESGDQMSADVFNISINGWELATLYQNKTIAMSSIRVDSSRINLDRPEDKVSRTVIKLPLDRVVIGQFDLKDNHIAVKDKILDKQIELRAIRLAGEQLDVDSLVDIKRWFSYLEGLDVSGSGFEESISDDYKISVDSYAYNLSSNELGLKEIKLIPLTDRYTYSQKLSLQKNWFDVQVRSIQIFNPDLEAMAIGKYRIPKINMESAVADVYRDKSVPFPEDRYMPMLQKTLHDLDYPLWIDTLHLTSTIKYTEKPVDSELEGVMTFDDIDAYLVNVRTSDTLRDKSMKLLASGKMYNSAPFNLKVDFDQSAPNYSYHMVGSVSDFDLTLLNQMLGPVAGVNIKSGYGQNIQFNFEAADRVAIGEMRFRYDDLKITILNKKTHEAEGLGRGIKTFFANTFVVKKKNPGVAFFVKKGDIFYERDPSRAIFNDWGKALISGAVSSIGINKSTRAQKKYVKLQESEEKERLKQARQEANSRD